MATENMLIAQMGAFLRLHGADDLAARTIKSVLSSGSLSDQNRVTLLALKSARVVMDEGDVRKFAEFVIKPQQSVAVDDAMRR